jgi:hypothetical protein
LFDLVFVNRTSKPVAARVMSESRQRSHTGDCKSPGLFPAVDGQRVISDGVFMNMLSKPSGNKSPWAPVSSLKGSFALGISENHCVGEGQVTT